MIIKCWGSRGSIPVSGGEYLKYGGDTTCIEVRTKRNEIIIIDAGTGIRRLGKHLIKEDRHIFHFIMTHAHWDHLMGFPYFQPLYLENTEIRMHRCPFPKKYMQNMISKVMAPPNFPVKYADVRANIIYEEGEPTQFEIGEMLVIPINLSHPNTGKGYKFIEDGKTFVFLTDNELGYIHPRGLNFDAYVDFCKDADLLFHDAEFTPEEYKSKIEWGHSKYDDTLNLALYAGVKRLGLFHLNQDRHDDEMDKIVNKCRDLISEETLAMECFAVGADMVMEL